MSQRAELLLEGVSSGERLARVPASRWGVVLADVVLTMVVLAYHGSFSVPFHFDDVAAIVANPTKWHWGEVGVASSSS